jgi:lysophospholipase L1-like esterase
MTSGRSCTLTDFGVCHNSQRTFGSDEISSVRYRYRATFSTVRYRYRLNVTSFSMRSFIRRFRDDWKQWLHAKADVVMLGDSITQACPWENHFPRLAIENCGVGGDTTYEVLARLDAVCRFRPQRVFLLIGINDLNTKVKSTVTMSNYESIAATLRAHLPDAALFLQSVLPVGRRWPCASNHEVTHLNAFIEECASRHGSAFIDLYPDFRDSDGYLRAELTGDGLHLNKHGYALWMKILHRFVEPVPNAESRNV